MLIWQPLHEHIESNISRGDAVLLLFSPYIKLEPLKRLIESCKATRDVKVVARWNPADIVSGVSDLEIFPYLQDKAIPLYIHSKIHLKLYVFSSNQGFHTSGNITQGGLGYLEHSNVELGCNVPLNTEDWTNIYSIVEESISVTEEVYETYLKYLEENKDKVPPLPELILPDSSRKEYSISCFPASKTPEDLWDYYSSADKENVPPEDVRRCVHDLVLYDLKKSGLKKDDFEKRLEVAFKQEPFIKALADMIKIDGSCRFGTVNDWIHQKCMDVPLPYRWELKENTNTLYNWLSYFYDEIEWDVPGKRSQVIYWKEK